MDTSISSASTDISILSTFDMDCTPEYGMNGFMIYQERDNTNKIKAKKANYCKPTKSFYVSKKTLKTESKTATTNLDCFVDIVVGSTEVETEDAIGYPLRAFQFKFEGTGKNRKCYYQYSTMKLKNMGKLKDERLKVFANLRSQNTQAN